jgi:hypothetical protein
MYDKVLITNYKDVEEVEDLLHSVALTSIL